MLYYKRFPKTDISISEDQTGRFTFTYGGAMGSRSYDSAETMAEDVLSWLADYRKKLIARAAEIEQVERAVERRREVCLEARV